ncbi:MAG: HAMP domain-containing histidine kinase, partial [Bdellovibrionales bacterium]|nr:HAMP domain-containing histidine kinase [Bdellovibrionales bacterium]
MKLSTKILIPPFAIVVLFSLPLLYMALIVIPKTRQLKAEISTQRMIFREIMELRDLRTSAVRDLALLELQNQPYLLTRVREARRGITVVSQELVRGTPRDTTLSSYIQDYVESERQLSEVHDSLAASFAGKAGRRSWALYNSSRLLNAFTEARGRDLLNYLGKSIDRLSANLNDLYVKITWGMSALLVCALLVIAGKAYLLNTFLLEPLYNVLFGLKRISSGRFVKDIQPTGQHDEMSELVESFNLMQRALRESREQAEMFNAIAAHDLKEPLTTIISYADALAFGGIISPDEVKDVIPRVRENAEVGLTMVNDLLDLARSAPSATEFKKVDLNELMEEVIDVLSRSIHETGARLRVGELGEIKGDPRQLATLMRNLIGNALKYRRANVVPSIEIFMDLDPEHPGFVRLHVQDNGSGFEVNTFDDLLRPFHRAPGTRVK